MISEKEEKMKPTLIIIQLLTAEFWMAACKGEIQADPKDPWEKETECGVQKLQTSICKTVLDRRELHKERESCKGVLGEHMYMRKPPKFREWTTKKNNP